MAKSVSVLFVSSEVFPFAKESGIGDVAYSLSLAIKEQGNDIRVMLPKYGCVSERKNKIHEINRLRDMLVTVGEEEELATVKSSSIHNAKAKVQAYVTTNARFFDDMRGIYHDPDTWEEYPDNAERFIFFQRTVVDTMLTLGWFPDIVHCNDWQTALIPAYMRLLYPQKFKKTKIVFTIHNFYRQGVFPLSIYKKTELPLEEINNFKHKNMINFMKSGITYANYITTVSPTYAKEILNDKVYSGGLNTILKEKNDKFSGILNGIDVNLWNPAKDEFIKSRLGSDFDEFKYNNKVALCQKFGLDFKLGVPLLAMIPRIGYQKGTSLIIDSADELFKMDLQFVLLGQGDEDLKAQLVKVAEKYPDKFKYIFDFDDELSHQIEAGADIFLMPSQYEPCGLNLMYSLVYGTVPLVRATGGLKDVATQYDKKTKTGNAFVFKNYDKSEFVKKVAEALDMYQESDHWEQIIENGMAGDYSWKQSASKYLEIYRSILKD